jgi:hypothetical protein
MYTALHFFIMDIYVDGTEGTLILTFRDKTVSSRIKDLAGRNIRQSILTPLSVLPSKKVLSDISIRMKLVRVDGHFQGIEQNIRLEVELRSLQEHELRRLTRLFQQFQSTVDEIAQLTQQL